ncbi:hypothetical protein CLIB1444_06S07646 [[Candida] jaroonii]|uniref:Uncharacterized protein n=1 Tax=[Candida] jaroonii TaxID=467808 RepID=A0ACA9Y9F3_9ASCO|nr:hypothetical protein CLIB1444_06S07646 [[Candida] jaroonii]
MITPDSAVGKMSGTVGGTVGGSRIAGGVSGVLGGVAKGAVGGTSDSPCGVYTATITGNTVTVHSDHSKTYRLPSSPTGGIKWEHVVSGDSTKFAVVVESMVAVIDLRYDEPMIIYEEEGVEEIEWIRPVGGGGGSTTGGSDSPEISAGATSPIETNEGAYVNSKQLLVYTTNYLQAKLYSLDCTHTLWCIDKPITRMPIYRPDERFWTVVSSWRPPGTDDLFPLVHQMYNDGSQSFIFHQTTLPDPLLSTNFVLEWARSGKCMVYFNGTDILGGFKLRVVPVLGVGGSSTETRGIGAGARIGSGGTDTSSDSTNGANGIPQSKPILSLTYLNEASDDSPTTRNSSYYMTTMLHRGQDLVSVVSAGYDHDLEIIVVSVDLLRITRTVTIKSWEGRSWYQQFDGYTTTYVQGTKPPVWDIKSVVTLDEYLVVQNEKSVAVIRYVDGTFVPIDVIHTDKIVDMVVGDDIVVVTDTHRLVYDFESIVLGL